MSRRDTAAAHRLAFLLEPAVLAVVILLYGAARAATLSITHDEALTYLLHLGSPWGALVAHTGLLPSNNHLLNTAAVKALLTVLQPTELVLRLPALVGLALYLWAAARLVAAATSGIRRQLGFLLLAANPFVIDLLVLSRGYALALGLTLVAVTLIAADRPSASPHRVAWRHAIAAMAAAGAVLANLAFAYSLGAVAAAAGVLALIGPAGPRRLRDHAVAALAAVAPFVLAAVLLTAVYTPATLARIRLPLATWGGEHGIWADTVPTLADGMLYGASWCSGWHDGAVAFLTVLAAVVLVATAGVLATRAARARIEPSTIRVLVFGLAFAGAWGCQVEAAHALFAVRYPIERAAVILIPCATLLFVALWEAAAQSPGGLAARGLAIAATGAVAHFAVCANLSHTFLWRFDAAGREAMRLVAVAAAPLAPGALRLGVSWLLEPAANYYRVTSGIAGLAPVTRDDPRIGFDLYYLAGPDRELVQDLRLHVCAEYPVAGTLLAAPPALPCPSPR
jgi:hypothetical protein